jgi:hypothetical protein
MPLYQSLRRIKGKGFTYDFNLQDVVKIPTIIKLHIYRYEGNSNQMMKHSLWNTKSGENGVL